MRFLAEFIRLGPAMFIFMEVLELLLAKFVFMDLNNDEMDMAYEFNIDSFDYIIGRLFIIL